MLDTHAMFGQPPLPILKLGNREGDVQLALAAVGNGPVLASALLAEQQNLMPADAHGGDPLVRIDRLEPQHLAVELHGTGHVRDIQTGLDYVGGVIEAQP